MGRWCSWGAGPLLPSAMHGSCDPRAPPPPAHPPHLLQDTAAQKVDAVLSDKDGLKAKVRGGAGRWLGGLASWGCVRVQVDGGGMGGWRTKAGYGPGVAADGWLDDAHPTCKACYADL